MEDPASLNYERAIDALKDVKPPTQFQFGKWRKIGESGLKKIAILRVASPQTRVAALRSLEYSQDLEYLVDRNPSDREIQSTLRKHGIRFHNAKTPRIRWILSNNLTNTINEVEHLSGRSLADERKARDRIKDIIPGMGLKTTSDFLKDIGFSKYLAVLDSRNLNFLKEYDLAPSWITQSHLSRKKIYYYLEEVENELAKRLGITVSELDERIMTITGSERPHKL